MPQHLQYLAIVATVGTGVFAGLLLAFSLVVMRALRELPPTLGMRTMQRINVLIVTPLFLLLFLGSSVACVALLIVAWRRLPAVGALLLLLGSVVHLIGPLGITVAFNVPLNNRLAALSGEQADAQWPAYVSSWLLWNHIRTSLGVLATGLLSVGLVAAAQGA